jgi:hypothetical protein
LDNPYSGNAPYDNQVPELEPGFSAPPNTPAAGVPAQENPNGRVPDIPGEAPLDPPDYNIPPDTQPRPQDPSHDPKPSNDPDYAAWEDGYYQGVTDGQLGNPFQSDAPQGWYTQSEQGPYAQGYEAGYPEGVDEAKAEQDAQRLRKPRLNKTLKWIRNSNVRCPM